MGASADDRTAWRATARGRVQGVGFRAATVREADRLGARGWVRNAEDGSVRVHAEGPPGALAALREFLAAGPPGAAVEAVDVEPVAVEGHEQFAVRGVPAGRFVVRRAADAGGFELGLEVGDAVRAWLLRKEPSMDPATRRMALQLDDRPGGSLAGGEGEAWDRGSYERGGRVPWPEALERGHAVFVLHGERLRGGFALQRTRAGANPQWLLVKRRDEWARRGSRA